jgi:hypothetical protein
MEKEINKKALNTEKQTIYNNDNIQANTINTNNENIVRENSLAKKLEEIEKITDPKKRADEKVKVLPKEYGYKTTGPEPTRYGDWDVKGKVVDF